MFLLVTSVLALAIGPALYRMADTARWTLLSLDGFIMAAVTGLVVVHIVPHSIAVAGPLALFLGLVGFLGPSVIERYLHKAARTAHQATLVLACFGLMVHAFFDGVALGAAQSATGHHHEGSLLAVAVVLHRLPVAVTIWWLLRPSAGIATAVLTLLGLAIATIMGYFAVGAAGFLMDAAWVAFLQTLVAGSLLHVVIHRPPPLSLPSSAGRSRFAAGIGALAGIALVAMLADTHLPWQRVPGEMNFRETFLTLALESAPALLLGFALAGLIKVYLPQASLRWMRTGNAASESLRGVAFGLPLPICSCGVVPVYRSLISSGVPVTAGMAFLVATPELGLDALLISLPLLGGEFTLVRAIAAALVAFAIGAVIGKLAQKTAPHNPVSVPEAPVAIHGSPLRRFALSLRFGLGEVVDHVGPWLLLGLMIASLVEPMIDGRWFTLLPWGTDVLLFALIGIPTYVCASGATPLVAILIHKGISPGAALAFLLAGPATNITTFGVLADMHGRRVAFAFAGAIAGLAVGLGLLTNVFLQRIDGIALHESSSEDPSILAMLCLAALVVMFALSLVRMGPRGFVNQVLMPHGDHSDHKDCDDGCHDHGGHSDHHHTDDHKGCC